MKKGEEKEGESTPKEGCTHPKKLRGGKTQKPRGRKNPKTTGEETHKFFRGETSQTNP